MRYNLSVRRRPLLLIFAALFGLFASPARAAESLCDSSFQDCRSPLINLIRAEHVGIDVGFWFMEDQRYVSEIIKRGRRRRAGSPDRRPDRQPDLPAERDRALTRLPNAGIPMVKKVGGGIMHFKMMLFAGQNIVEFGSANYSPNAFVPVTPYTQLRLGNDLLRGRPDHRQQLQDQGRQHLDRRDQLQGLRERDDPHTRRTRPTRSAPT